MPSPIQKGKYELCSTCEHKLPNTDIKYPCKFTHGYLRQKAEVYYTRDFRPCPCYSKTKDIILK